MSQISMSVERGFREHLEDVVQAVELHGGSSRLSVMRACLVCDGVGGVPGGDVAARITACMLIQAIVAAWTAACKHGEPQGGCAESVRDGMRKAAQRANRVVAQRAKIHFALHGMATTLVAVVELPDRLVLLWLGDSRAYVDTGNVLVRLTRDHSKVAALVEDGQLDPRDATVHPDQHVITRYIGDCQGCEPEMREYLLSPGDVIILCSDGLTDVVADSRIHRMVRACLDGRFPFAELAPRLVRQALRAGTRDNVSVVCMQHNPQNGQPAHTFTNQYHEVAAQALWQQQEAYHA